MSNEVTVMTPEIMSREVAVTFSPAQVSSAWLAAVDGLRSIIAFGAILVATETVLTRENGAKKTDPGYGGGLQAWLTEHCPDVNYKTAMRFKRLAEAAIESCSMVVEAGEAARLLGTSTHVEEIEDQRKLEALEEVIEGKSQRDLLGAAYRPAGRPKGTPGGGRRAFTAEERATDAMDEVKERLSQLSAFCVGPKLLALPEEYRLRVATTLKDLSNTFREGRPWAQ